MLGILFAALPTQTTFGQNAQTDESVQEEEHQFTNALAGESSPYLLMHAHNPVNWYPWNEKTLAKAKSEDKPIFLSIGYSSCHWCHVMERESFLDKEIAAFLNEHYICIKVDREERPDVDDIYMHALLRVKGSGGWPMSMFLTPEAKPFFGGTYFPARDGERGSRLGFLTIVTRIEKHFREDRTLIERDADKLTEATRQMLASRKPVEGLPIQRAWTGEAINELAILFDPKYGGFRFQPSNPKIPKFPEPSNLFFLIDWLQRPINQPGLPDRGKEVRRMLETTCERMMLGGIHDHLGGGFHRYSVDRFWAIPHFEKMLYDNGQLASVYAEAYAQTQRDDFRRTTEGILDFVSRELTDPAGGFYSSLDAESEGEEGKFYRWAKEELQSLLTKEEFERFAIVYRINEDPNFEEDYYAPQLKQSLAKHAEAMNLTEAKLEALLQPIRKKLFDARAKRIRPLLDHKILTAWNGLMIRGYADAGRILKRQDYIDVAVAAANFALKELVTKEGRVQRTYTKGTAKLNGYSIDYACLINGLLAIHRATGDQQWLTKADQLQKKHLDLFWDTNGGFFYTSSDHEVLIARTKKQNDGAMPSSNSVAAENLYYLGQQLKNSAYIEKAKQTVLAASPMLTRTSQSAPRLLITSAKFLESAEEE